MSKEVKLVGVDVYSYVKLLSNLSFVNVSAMSPDENKAYLKGVTDTMACLKKTLHEATADETGKYEYVAVHVPNLETITEFDSIDEIIHNDELGLFN